MLLELAHIIGISISLIAILALSIYSGKFAKKSQGAKSWIVAGAIMGTLVGGSSTVGTSQLAYHYGMSAWWFTLGSGIACLILAIVYVKPLRNSRCSTLTAIIRQEYGPGCGMAASILSSFGSFINIISQLIAATAIIAVICPDLSLPVSLLISAVFMVLYIIFGGTKGSGIVGTLKMLLLYMTMLSGGVIVLSLCGGLGGILHLVDGIENPDNIHFYSLFARGAGTDLGACLSLTLGVITTQSYAQAVFMADSTAEAKKGALLSAVMIPPVGIGGILVGLYMRAVHPGIVAKTALTLFVTEYMPPLVGGLVLGALFIAVVGTGAGLALGIATVLKKDILPPLLPAVKQEKHSGLWEKALIILTLSLAVLLSTGSLSDTILSFAFLSMGLRGATIFLPLCCALWLPGRVDKHYALLSILSGPLVVLLFGLLDVLPFDPLFAGVLASVVIMAAGFLASRSKHKTTVK